MGKVPSLSRGCEIAIFLFAIPEHTRELWCLSRTQRQSNRMMIACLRCVVTQRQSNRMMIACLRCVELRVHASRVKERACKTFYTCWYTMTSWPCEWDYTSILKAGPCEKIPNRRLRLNKRLRVTFFCFVSHNLRSGAMLETVFRSLAHAGINMVYVDFRRTFQWREYSIWATNNCMLSKRRFWKP